MRPQPHEQRYQPTRTRARRTIANRLAARACFRQPLQLPLQRRSAYLSPRHAVRLRRAPLGLRLLSPPARSRSGSRPNNVAAREAESGQGRASRQGRAAALPTSSFAMPDDEPSLAGRAEGKPVLVNIWATWCAPCVKELPTLQALARTRRRRRGVIAVSQDMAPRGSVDAFLDKNKLGRSGSLARSEDGLVVGARAPKCCRRRSCTMRRAGRCGATSATSTGRARKRLSCLPSAGRPRSRLSSRPSIAARPSAISASPMKSCAASCSDRNSAPSRIATGGTSRVTSKALVAPARSISRK